MMKISTSIILGLLFCNLSNAQELNSLKTSISLEDAIELSKSKSIDYLTAKNNSEVSFWEYKSYQSSLLPSLSINGILPNYRRSINRITADDGTDLFISQNQAFSSLSLDVDQIVPFTGGQLSVSSSLNRIDVFSDPNFKAYSSTPLTISYFQESLFYNPYRWEKKIMPLIFEESRRELIEDIEEISLNTTIKFFDYAIAKIKTENSENNKLSQDTIYKISKGRFDIGKLFENDLLQSELSLLNAKKELIITRNELKLKKQELLDQLGIDEDFEFDLIVPEELKFIKIDSVQLFKKAFENRKLLIEHKRKVLEAEQEIAKTKSDDVKIGVTGNFGLSQQDEIFNQVYSNLLVQQNFSLSLSIPLFTWGRRKAEKKIAIANLDLIKSSNEQELRSVKRELSLKYLEWNQLELSVQISKRASEISLRRYEASKRRFAIGKVSITDLNIAQNEKDKAVINYYESLREYWKLYYDIRKATLFDFENGIDIKLSLSN